MDTTMACALCKRQLGWTQRMQLHTPDLRIAITFSALAWDRYQPLKQRARQDPLLSMHSNWIPPWPKHTLPWRLRCIDTTGIGRKPRRNISARLSLPPRWRFITPGTPGYLAIWVGVRKHRYKS